MCIYCVCICGMEFPIATRGRAKQGSRTGRKKSIKKQGSEGTEIIGGRVEIVECGDFRII